MIATDIARRVATRRCLIMSRLITRFRGKRVDAGKLKTKENYARNEQNDKNNFFHTTNLVIILEKIIKFAY